MIVLYVVYQALGLRKACRSSTPGCRCMLRAVSQPKCHFPCESTQPCPSNIALTKGAHAFRVVTRLRRLGCMWLSCVSDAHLREPRQILLQSSLHLQYASTGRSILTPQAEQLGTLDEAGPIVEELPINSPHLAGLPQSADVPQVSLFAAILHVHPFSATLYQPIRSRISSFAPGLCSATTRQEQTAGRGRRHRRGRQR